MLTGRIAISKLAKYCRGPLRLWSELSNAFESGTSDDVRTGELWVDILK